MRRLFWVTLGLGFGAVAAVGVLRWANRTAEAMKPSSMADQLGETALEWRDRLASAFEAGRNAMADRERELRATYGVDGKAT
jgi:hypothetical protein